MRLRISGTGCSLMDFLYTDISFSSDAFATFRSRSDGDGGLVPGKLVFVDDIERFAGQSFDTIRGELTGGRPAAASNLGGPSIVALIHAAQLLEGTDTAVSFYGARGSDATAAEVMKIVRRTPVHTDGYVERSGQTPFTVVFSDPSYDGGHGERTFVNNIGTAGDYGPEDLPAAFYDGNIVAFGGTALVPQLHLDLQDPLKRAKQRGRFTVVNTVYDFKSQTGNPRSRWPLGRRDETFRYIDLFIADREEALRTSGTQNITDAIDFLKENGVGSAIITQGSEPIGMFAKGGEFEQIAYEELPVSETIAGGLRAGRISGDTTGCGDNFVGGVLASLVGQIRAGGIGHLDLRAAASIGIVSGGFACSYVGGTFIERRPGDKRTRIRTLYDDYLTQIAFRPKRADGIFQ